MGVGADMAVGKGFWFRRFIFGSGLKVGLLLWLAVGTKVTGGAKGVPL
jgi:hypothetical protein